ncbi:MAG: NINE protein [Saprospiraceae bacterium]|nr:NINE protein [Saprospiraceae bacterium]
MRPKSRIKAILLALFTGFVGGHKFYLGKVGGFIGFMILFIVSLNVFRSPVISFIAGIIDAIKLINMSDEVFNEKYNQTPRWQTGRPQQQAENQRKGPARQAPSRQINSTVNKSPVNRTKAEALKTSGIKKYKDFDLDGAIEDFTEALKILPSDVSLHFNVACAYSLTEQKDKAYHHLSQSVALGLKDVQKILTHDDLAFVRIQPEFDAFRASGFREFGSVNNATDTAGQKGSEPELKDFSKSVPEDALLAQLTKLAELRQKGVLSEDEFQFERKKILRQ